MSKVKVSIVVPVYNGAEYLKSCHEQLSRQTLDNIEIIIVDDGSSDETAKIAFALDKENDNVHFYHQDNKGVSIARNHGISKASGEYIGFVDVDDKYDSDMYELLYNAAVSNDLDIVSSNDNYGKYGELTILDDKKQILDLFLTKKIKISACFKLFKKSLFSEISFPEGIQIYEDYMTVYRGLNLSSKVGLLNVKKYHYIKHEGSNSRADVFKEKYFDMISVVNETCDDILSQYPELKDSCIRRKAITYLRISKIYYLRKHPEKFKGTILELRRWIKGISIKDARRYYSFGDFVRFWLYLYAFPLFILLIKTVDKE